MCSSVEDVKLSHWSRLQHQGALLTVNHTKTQRDADSHILSVCGGGVAVYVLDNVLSKKALYTQTSCKTSTMKVGYENDTRLSLFIWLPLRVNKK